jgi:hypothetical protein
MSTSTKSASDKASARRKRTRIGSLRSRPSRSRSPYDQDRPGLNGLSCGELTQATFLKQALIESIITHDMNVSRRPLAHRSRSERMV